MRRIPWRGILEGAGLALALAFVFLMMYVPHMDTTRDPPPQAYDVPQAQLAGAAYEQATGQRDGYPYPLHVDEHLHWAVAAKLQRVDTVMVGHAYSPSPSDENAFFSLRGAIHERGFHILLAQGQELTGIPFLQVFHYGPALWMTFTAFGVWALVRPHPAAVPAAAFVGLIPTTVRFLGPAFLVPIGFSLAWLPLAAMLTEPARKNAGAAFLLLWVVVWAFFVHLIAGFAAVAVLAGSALLGAPADRRTLLTLLAIAGAPVLWLYRSFTSDIVAEVDRTESLPIDFTIFDNWGLLALGGWVLGSALLLTFPPRTKNRTPMAGFLFGSAFALALIVLGVANDWGRYATYARWHPPFFLMASVPLGYAVAWSATRAHWLARQAPRHARYVRRTAAPAAIAIGLVATVFLTAPGAAVHLQEDYYQVIGDEDWNEFTYVDENVGDEYEVFLTHPWRAPILNARTGKLPHAVLLPGTPPTNDADYRTYVRTGGDLEFYVMNDITLVVGGEKPPVDEIVELAPGVYALEPAIAKEIHEIRQFERRASR